MEVKDLIKIGQEASYYAFQLSLYIQSRWSTLNEFHKEDLSPVTAADFGSQAVVCLVLQSYDSKISILGEEEIKLIRNKNLLETVVGAVNFVYPKQRFLKQMCNLESESMHENYNSPSVWSEDEVIAAINSACKDKEGSFPNEFWTVDPIDGTKGFLRQGQYAIGLSYIRNGNPIVGIISSPKCPFSGWYPRASEVPFLPESNFEATMFVAGEGYGAHMKPIRAYSSETNEVMQYEDSLVKIPIHSSNLEDISQVILGESFESTHTNTNLSQLILQHLNIQSEPIRIDSMTKYGLLARGEIHSVLRLKTDPELIWDQAPGYILLKEAGGVVTDIHNQPLDFSLKSRYLSNNRCVVASANQTLHSKILETLTLCESFLEK